LALRYETGAWGVRQNDKEALRWFRAAVGQGHVPAMQGLVHLYEQDLIGVRPDPKEATRWRERAAAAGAR